VCAAEGIGITLLPITGAPSDVQRVAQATVDAFVVWTTSDDDPVLDAVADTGLPAVVHAGPQRRGLPVIASTTGRGHGDRAGGVRESPAPARARLPARPRAAPARCSPATTWRRRGSGDPAPVGGLP
jgi:hypothetical protein